MRAFCASLLLLAIGATAIHSADVRLPDPQLPDPPPPAPMPSAVYTLGADDIYPVESDSPLVIRSCPKGLVAFQEMKPGTYFWKDGGQWKQKEFKGPHLYFGTATGKGRVEVEFFWAEKDTVKARTALIDCLVGPQPPPPDPPGPKPPDPKPEPVTSFRVLFIRETGDPLTQAQHSTIFAKSVADFLNAKTTREGGRASWARVDDDDIDIDAPPAVREMWAAVKPEVTTVPCLAIGVNRKVEIIPLPSSPEEAIKTFKKYLGEK